MLYTYKDIPHPIKQFQRNICYFFEHLFDLEPNPYDINVLLRTEFISLIDSSNKFKKYLKDIAEQYISLPLPEKELIRRAYANHLNIETICNDTTIQVVKYAEIINEEFRVLLKEFLTWLWDDYNNLPQALRNEYKDVQDHFNEFKKVQIGKVCPFCGIFGLKPKSIRRRRNAYDHYIPKATYPFVSINFNNLFPACDECNSDEKGQYDTPIKDGARQAVIFPFDTTYSFEELIIYIDHKENFNNVNLGTLLSDINWNISFTVNSGTVDKYNTWDDIFKIKTRYKEYILEYEDTWFTDFIIKKFKEKVLINLSVFENYRDELINDSRDLIIKDPLAVLKYIYFSFIFSIPNIENKLKQIVAT
jgi:5-methylcytosine-specific restriction endonuclease McrA